MIVVIDYGVGNLFSVEKALARFGRDVVVTGKRDLIEAADKLLLPGVGDFGECMRCLEAAKLTDVIKECSNKGTPLLGICVGEQILFEQSEEAPGVKGLGIFRGKVKRINAPGLKVPHMGWNSVDFSRVRHPLFKGLGEHPYFYFVHSYHCVPEDSSIIAATTDYGERLTAAVASGNVMAAQFHPEKSGDVGLQVLRNFVEM